MASETPGPVAAYLAEARREAESLSRTHAPSWGTVPKIRRVLNHEAHLLAAVEAALKVADDAEHGALRWEQPLPVPGWVEQLREAIAAKLLGEEDERG